MMSPGVGDPHHVHWIKPPGGIIIYIISNIRCPPGSLGMLVVAYDM